MINIKNILDHKFVIVLFTFCFCLMAVNTAEAKTITNHNEYIDESRLEMFDNMFENSDYYSYLLSVESNSSGYSSYNDYYFCLSDEKVNIIDLKNASLNCDEFYHYYRVDSDYVFESINDDSLIVNNSIYYSDNAVFNNDLFIALIFGIFLTCSISLFIKIIDEYWW